MNNELNIENRFADTVDLTKQDIPLDTFGKLRVYRYSPESIMIQVRTSGPTNYNRNGATKNMISGMTINTEEAESLIAFLQEKIEEIKPMRAQG